MTAAANQDQSSEPKIYSDEIYMDLAREAAKGSHDRSRQTGAVIVASNGKVLCHGANRFPTGLDHTIDARHERPAKYFWTEHAERTAIYAAAREGIATRGSRMFMPWYPCADCARAIILSGIIEIIAIEPDWTDVKFAADFAIVKEMLAEAGIPVKFLPGQAPQRP